MSVTPKLSTVIKSRIERSDRGKQTAFPAKVLSYNAAANTVELEPQFIETWFTRDYERKSEEGESRIDAIPVCFPRHMSWTVDAGDFGLVICTKYSLDRWRTQRQRMDPGDLRRFTMAGATFHPVLMDEVPDPAQDFVALKKDVTDIKTELDKIETTLGSIVGGGPTHVVAAFTTTYTNGYTVTASSKVKVK